MYLFLKVNNNVLNENSILRGKNMESIGRYMLIYVQAMTIKWQLCVPIASLIISMSND